MSDYQNLSDEAIELVHRTFGITTSQIKKFETQYKNLVEKIPYQYLAHIIRSLETYIRNKPKMKFFRIFCTPSKVKGIDNGLAAGFYKENRYYNICYNENADELQVRVAIAHELGHLFYLIEYNKSMDETHEPMSSLFGTFVMIHKLKTSSKKKHHSEKDIVDDFSLLMNRENGKLNVSN